MTDIRLLAIDLDDTLVREDNTISDYTRSNFEKSTGQGHSHCDCHRPHVPDGTAGGARHGHR